jgi:uncharacterized protein YecE (DUF72 family)
MERMARVLVGTSGFSYDDWVGPVYPPGTPKGDFLSLYAREFPVLELNYTYYAQPAAKSLARMVESTPPGFLFALKAHRSMTHEISGGWERDVETFRTGIRPLVDAGRLCAVLLQFPYSFAYTPESRARLSALSRMLAGLPLAVEFRKSDWIQERVLDGLRERGIALVSVDEPELPRLLKPTVEVTADFSYVRFHGRNKKTWWTGDNASRYDYLYAKEELEEWAGRIEAILRKARLAMIFFNNHRRGMAAQNAREMRELLAARGIGL